MDIERNEFITIYECGKTCVNPSLNKILQRRLKQSKR